MEAEPALEQETGMLAQAKCFVREIMVCFTLTSVQLLHNLYMFPEISKAEFLAGPLSYERGRHCIY